MRSLAEATTRWEETAKHSTNLADLQRAVKFNGPTSPCLAGCRSICWKAFLLGGTSDTNNWCHALLESRSTYASLRDHFLKYIKHPEYLSTVTVDPLTDDAGSPWNTLRQDEALRAEILQDVQRLPDEHFYHQPDVQTLILDVLFIFCKLNPDVGGYRQGMHELLAPIVYVVEQDAINPLEAGPDASADLTMVEMLDAKFVEHDAFALFSKLMDNAKLFYEVGEDSRQSQSTIVAKSQHIHEGLLYRLDPDLSTHLKNIEVLPQIFLIRWIRLLFSREFPFEQMLVLWDTLLSIDPELQLVDYICTAMLIRIRWELLEADYSTALQLLLKYPPPKDPHGPHTFVGDAVYLRDHLSTSGASTLIMKYTGKPPESPKLPPTPGTPGNALGIRQNARPAKSPLSPARFIQQQGGVEALFQGAARGVLERSERLGINQAVRDAVMEIRRNVNEARSSMKAGRDIFSESGPSGTAMKAVAAMDRRNRQLAAMLDDTINTLRTLAGSDLEDKKQSLESLEVAAAKVQFVKVYLEDSTMALPEEGDAIPASPGLESPTTPSKNQAPEPLNEAVAAMAISTPDMATDSRYPEVISTPQVPPQAQKAIDEADKEDKMDTDPQEPSSSSAEARKPSGPPTDDTLRRPQAPNPTRSTIAQSSFAWMLESDESAATKKEDVFSSPPSRASAGSGAAAAHRKRPSANANRERTAFLFGEVPSDNPEQVVLPEDIFGLQPLKSKKAAKAT